MRRAVLAIALTCLAIPARGQEAPSPCRLDRPDRYRNMSGVDACTALIDDPATPPRQLADALYVRAELRRGYNDPGQAWADFQALIDRAPGDPRGYVGRGRFLESNGYDRDARRDFDRAIAVDPAYAPAWHARGTFHRRRGDHALAIADLDTAIRLDPSALQARVDRGIAWRLQGNRDRAFADFDEAIRRDPDFGPAYQSRAVTHHQRYDYAAAAADYRIAARLIPDDSDVQNGLCFNLAFGGGDLDEARAACDRAIWMRSYERLYRVNRGLLGLRQGRYRDAWADFDTALRKRSRDPQRRLDATTARYGRGVAAIRLGRERAGRADLRRAMRRDPAIAADFERLGIGPPAAVSPPAAAAAR